MEESAFIKCPSCLSEVEITRSAFYQLAGKAVRCPECNSPIPLSPQTSWQDISTQQPPGDVADLQERMIADLQESLPSEEELDPIHPPSIEPVPAQGRPPPKTFTRTSKSLNKWILLIAGIMLLCVVGILICLHPAKTSLPPPITPTITTTTTIPDTRPVEAPTPVVLVDQAPNDEVTAFSLFAAYEKAFLEGDWVAAKARLKEVDSSFADVSARDAFLHKVLPDGKRRVMRLMMLCAVCDKDGGKCPQCKGNALCTICKGKKSCTWCNGRSVRKQLCRECACRACSASGICRNCQGAGVLTCRNCGGLARTDMVVRETCRACGGTGTRPGLRAAQGEPTRLPCLICRSRGWVTKTQTVPCESCNGTGRTACTTCGGKGICTVCQGKSHKIPCAACNDTGSITVYCPKCEGSGHCANCHGTGKCNLCKGTGVCQECQGKGLTEIRRLSVSSEWLLHDQGSVLIEPDGTLKPETATGHARREYNGRMLSFEVKPDEIAVIVQKDSSEGVRIVRKP